MENAERQTMIEESAHAWRVGTGRSLLSCLLLAVNKCNP